MTMDGNDTPSILNRKELAGDPFMQFELWLEEARADHDIIEPDTMALATATKDGTPSARMVMLRDYDERGFVFYTNYESPKGKQLAENARAELLFYWGKLNRQIRISGAVTKVSRKQSEAYFQKRPRGHRLAATVSEQSEIISKRAELEGRLDKLRRESKHADIPLPPFWGCYRLLPDKFEFWQSGPNRLHDRFLYTSILNGKWRIGRLST